MKIYVLRHGQAESRAASDAQRQLTPYGRKGSAAAADTLLRHISADEQHLVAVLYSPFVRTTQTKECVSEVLEASGVNPFYAVSDKLLSETHPRDAASEMTAIFEKRLESDAADASVMLVISHQPLVSRLLSWLVDGDASIPAASQYVMSPSSLACVNSLYVAQGVGVLDGIQHYDE